MAGILLPLIVLWLHPTGSDLVEGSGSRVVAINYLVHGIALLAQPLVLLGLISLTQHMKWSVTATGAFVVYCLSVVATVTAALMSGFVGPDVIAQLRTAGAATAGDYRTLLRYTLMLNQAFANFSVIAACVAFILWSVGVGRTHGFPRLIGIIGLVIGTTLVAGLMLGKLVLDVQGILIATGLQAVWLFLVAVHLLRLSRTVPEPSPATV